MSIFKTQYRVLPMMFTYKDASFETLYMPQYKKWWWLKYQNVSPYSLKIKEQAIGTCIALMRLEKPFKVKNKY